MLEQGARDEQKAFAMMLQFCIILLFVFIAGALFGYKVITEIVENLIK